MKKIFFTLFTAALALLSFAQPPAFMNYQAVVRDAEGAIVAGQDVSFKIEILKGAADGTVVFRETHLATTSDQGLVTLPIFGGDHDGMWLEIDWSADDYFIKIYLGNSTGTDFQEMGTSQLLSVPYAMHAKTVSEEKQELAVSETQMSISGGNTVYLPETYDDFTITGTTVIGKNGLVISEITQITGTTEAAANTTSIDLPEGYTTSNTRVLSVDINVPLTLSSRKYGLGHAGSDGTVSYSLYNSSLTNVNRVTLEYPTELRGMSYRVVLLKTGIRLIPL